jgi:hypothetical protein
VQADRTNWRKTAPFAAVLRPQRSPHHSSDDVNIADNGGGASVSDFIRTGRDGKKTAG